MSTLTTTMNIPATLLLSEDRMDDLFYLTATGADHAWDMDRRTDDFRADYTITDDKVNITVEPRTEAFRDRRTPSQEVQDAIATILMDEVCNEFKALGLTAR